MRIIAILGALLLAAQSAPACQCGGPPPVAQAFQDADLVALGTVQGEDCSKLLFAMESWSRLNMNLGAELRWNLTPLSFFG